MVLALQMKGIKVVITPFLRQRHRKVLEEPHCKERGDPDS